MWALARRAPHVHEVRVPIQALEEIDVASSNAWRREDTVLVQRIRNRLILEQGLGM
jgi:hypothetical protein